MIHIYNDDNARHQLAKARERDLSLRKRIRSLRKQGFSDSDLAAILNVSAGDLGRFNWETAKLAERMTAGSVQKAAKPAQNRNAAAATDFLAGATLSGERDRSESNDPRNYAPARTPEMIAVDCPGKAEMYTVKDVRQTPNKNASYANATPSQETKDLATRIEQILSQATDATKKVQKDDHKLNKSLLMPGAEYSYDELVKHVATAMDGIEYQKQRMSEQDAISWISVRLPLEVRSMLVKSLHLKGKQIPSELTYCLG